MSGVFFFFFVGMDYTIYKNIGWVDAYKYALTMWTASVQFSAGLIINIIQKYIINPTTIYHNMKDRNVIK
jgi:hypothetical protein